MRAKTGTGAALNADNGFVALVITADDLNNAGLHTVLAAHAFIRAKPHPAAGPGKQSPAMTGPGTGRILASPANIRQKPALQSPGGTDPDSGFTQRKTVS